MSLRNVDFEAAFRRLADRRIEDAMKEGKFDNLPGAGKPIELEPMPAAEDARMVWWMLRIMRNNGFTPHELRWRKTLDYLHEELAKATDESRLERLVVQINMLVKQINTLGTNALNLGVAPVNLETERAHLRARIAK